MKEKTMSIRIRLVAPIVALGLLGGCATGPAPQSTSASGLSAGNAKLSVKMSSSIFLQPVAPSKRVVFLEGHNTSSAQGLNFRRSIAQDLMAKGYRLTNDPTRANYMLMWNIRYVGKETKTHTLGGAVAGGFGGALIGSAMGDHGLAGGLAGAAAGALIGHFLSAHRYLMVVDIQVEQRHAGAVTNTVTDAAQGLGNDSVTHGSGVRGWMIYRDRVGAQATGMRLTFSYAEPALTKEVAGEVAGIF